MSGICLRCWAGGARICAHFISLAASDEVSWEASMRRETVLVGAFLFVVGITCAARTACGQQIGKFVAVAANSGADHALTESNAASEARDEPAVCDKIVDTA